MANWWDQDLVSSQKPEQKPLSAGQVVEGAITNFPKSLGNVIGGVVEAVTSPIQTAKTVIDLGAGILQTSFRKAWFALSERTKPLGNLLTK